MAIDGDRFRRAMSRFATGITVVTSREGEAVHGTTVNAFCSVSLEPPLVLVCLDKATVSHHFIGTGKVFGVNILKSNQEDVAWALSRKGTPDLEAAHQLVGIPFITKSTGAPIIVGVQAYLDCRVVQTVEAGDHTIYIGLVEDAGWDEAGAPLVYFRSSYGSYLPKGTE